MAVYCFSTTFVRGRVTVTAICRHLLSHSFFFCCLLPFLREKFFKFLAVNEYAPVAQRHVLLGRAVGLSDLPRVSPPSKSVGGWARRHSSGVCLPPLHVPTLSQLRMVGTSQSLPPCLPVGQLSTDIPMFCPPLWFLPIRFPT